MNILETGRPYASNWLDPVPLPGSQSPGPLTPGPLKLDAFRPEGQTTDPRRPSLKMPPPDADRESAVDLLNQLNDADAVDRPGGERMEVGDGQGGDRGDSGDSGEGDGSNDIGGIVSNAAVLLGEIFAFYQKTFDNSIQLRNTMSRMNAQAVLASADAIRQQGLSNMVGNITGASLQLSMAGAGAFKSMQGLSGERNAMKARATTPDSPAPQTMNPTTPGGPPPVDAPSTTQSPPDRPDVPAPSPDLAPATDVTPAPTNSLADEMDNIAKVAQAKGTALTMLSRPVGDIATAGGSFAERLAMQEQKLNDGASTVNKNSADSMQDVANRDNALLAEMLRAIDSVAQSRSGAMSNIAGNIRA